MSRSFPRIATFKTSADFRRRIEELKIRLELDDEVPGGASPLGASLDFRGRRIGNRFCVLPMEGWDGTPEGQPSELTFRRWRRFGAGGAKLIWGGEAAAVRHDGRANPNQLVLSEANLASVAELRQALVEEHRKGFGETGDLYVGLQLTHSGRFCRPNDKQRLEPLIVYRHPVLDHRFGVPAEHPCLTDEQIDGLIGDFVAAARRAWRIGFDFVDIKHCHGYLGHEFLSAVARSGRYGGSFENRTRFLRDVVCGIRSEAPGLEIGVRVSIFDTVPFIEGPGGTGVPDEHERPYPFAFGADPDDPLQIRLDETVRFFELLRNLEIRLVCTSAGSPYYCPHIQRPALFPPSDGYLPPEDPLVGVARQIGQTARLKKMFPDLVIVGSAYSYLQEWLPNVAQACVRAGMADFIGLGRMILTYPELPADVLSGAPLRTKSICRTFSDCTTAPRNGLVSGCFPLDSFYKTHPHHQRLKEAKKHRRPPS